jgi:NAD(P)-dependent dehydrogenase (short-subunit alcohol dehydrogenase family)
MTTNSFAGKTALVIGGTSGMGKATAKLLLSLGAKLIVASKSGKSVDAAVAELGEHGEVTGKVLNLTDDADVKRFVREIGEFDRIDYLVNASGIFRPKPFLDSTPEDYDAFLKINRGFFFVTQAVAKKQKANGGGAIVNIGSYWATHAVKGTPTTAYSMAKAGLQSFTQHIAMELAAEEVRTVNGAKEQTCSSEQLYVLCLSVLTKPFAIQAMQTKPLFQSSANCTKSVLWMLRKRPTLKSKAQCSTVTTTDSVFGRIL